MKVPFHTRPFLAIDGEAIGPESDQRYALIADDSGDHLLDLQGLGTRAVFEWLLARPQATIPVCFGLGYDVNNWLVDVPPARLRELWVEQRTSWAGYRLEWLPGRWFGLRRDRDRRYVKVREVFGFFQSSFVNSLASWGFEPPSELAAMKRRRGSFTRADRERTIDYCVSECRLLVALMDALRTATADAGVRPSDWCGAGYLAGALLRSGLGRGGGLVREPPHSEHHRYDAEISDPDGEHAIMAGYYAGRIELLRQGALAPVETLDLRSAYPAAITQLPSLAGARLVERRTYDPAAEHALWRVSWDVAEGTSVMPFPVRRDFTIYWPRRGAGVYHAAEVRAAIDCGFDVDVHGGWVLKMTGQEGTSDSPFGFVADTYRKRARLKQRGHPAEKALKLALNSIYGKLAQGVGYQGRPPWQSYFWAGEVTARTRAAILRVAVRAREPVMISTDGIFCRGRAPATPARAGLGSWERGRLDSLFAAQAGVYQGESDGREFVKSRGFFARDIDYRELRAEFERHGPDGLYRYTSRRFVGLGGSMVQTQRGSWRFNRSLWRQWLDTERVVSLRPDRKLVPGQIMQAWQGGTVELRPCIGGWESEPYEPKRRLLDPRASEGVAGMEQPHLDAV